jgi:glutaredoxin
VAESLVVMYSRKTCGLCDKARALIEAERQRSRFRFDEVFIDGDDALEREYGLRVPVIEVDGRQEFEFEVEPVRFSRLVRR